MNAAYALAFILVINLITIWWVIALIWDYPVRSSSAIFYLGITIIPLLVNVTYLHFFFVYRDKYVLIYSENN